MVRTWAPMFRIMMGIPRQELERMSIPEMLDHLQFLSEVSRGG